MNAHPSIMLGLVKQVFPDSWAEAFPYLVMMVEDRATFFEKIMLWYGLPGIDFAKTVILVVLYNGNLRFWRERVKSPVPQLKKDLPDLVALQSEFLRIREEVVFKKSAFAPHLPALRKQLKALSRNADRTEEEISRSVLAYVLGHVESMATEAAWPALEKRSSVATSIIYDGGLVTHNPKGDLAESLPEAEQAIQGAIGFPLKLKEKDMFHMAPFEIVLSSRVAARQAALDAARSGGGSGAASSSQQQQD